MGPYTWGYFGLGTLFLVVLAALAVGFCGVWWWLWTFCLAGGKALMRPAICAPAEDRAKLALLEKEWE